MSFEGSRVFVATAVKQVFIEDNIIEKYQVEFVKSHGNLAVYPIKVNGA